MAKISHKIHPTCGLIPLKLASKIVAVIDMILGLVGIAWFIYMLSKHGVISLEAFEPTEQINYHTANNKGPQYVTGNGNNTNTKTNPTSTINAYSAQTVLSLTYSGFYIGYFYTGVNLTVFIFLLIGVLRQSPALCMFWFNVRCAVLVYKVVLLLIYLIAGLQFLAIQVPFILSMVVHLYGLWIVNCYVTDLRVQKLRRELSKNQETENNQDQQFENSVKSPQNSLQIDMFGDGEPDVPDPETSSNELRNGIEIIQRQRISSRPQTNDVKFDSSKE